MQSNSALEKQEEKKDVRYSESSELEKYECVVCVEVRLEPNSCDSCGAIICRECSPLLNKCPICSANRSQIKANMVLKRMIAQCSVDCKHGCGEKVQFSDMEAHDKRC